MYRYRVTGLVCLISMALAFPAQAQTEGASEDQRSVEQVVREVFIPEAMIVPRYPPDL